MLRALPTAFAARPADERADNADEEDEEDAEGSEGADEGSGETGAGCTSGCGGGSVPYG